MLALRIAFNSCDLYMVQRALGQRQITTAEICTRVSDDALKRVTGKT